MMFKRAPLSSGFMFVGIIGIIVFGIKMLYNTIDQTWGFLMLLFSIIIFIAAFVSITPDIPKEKDLQFNREYKEIERDFKKIDDDLSFPLEPSFLKKKRSR